MLLLRSSPAVGLFLLADSGSDILQMASGDLDCKLLCEKEEEARSASAMPGTVLSGSRATSKQASKPLSGTYKLGKPGERKITIYYNKP